MLFRSVPEDFNPTMLFSVVWPNGTEALLGNELTVEETAEEPSIDFTPMNMPVEQADSAGEEVSYTLVMLDPDAPYRHEPIYRSFRHWVVRSLFSRLCVYAQLCGPAYRTEVTCRHS